MDNIKPCNIHINKWVCVCMGFPDGSEGTESAWNAGHPGSIPGLGIP